MRRTRSRRPRAKGKKKATARAYVPAADEVEDRLLAAEARRALADPERIPYEQVRRDLGLD